MILDYLFVLLYNFPIHISVFLRDKLQTLHWQYKLPIHSCELSRAKRMWTQVFLLMKYWIYNLIAFTNIDLYFTNKYTSLRLKIFNQIVDYSFMISLTITPVLKHTKHHGIKIRKPLRISRTPGVSKFCWSPPQVRDTVVSLNCTWLYC